MNNLPPGITDKMTEPPDPYCMCEHKWSDHGDDESCDFNECKCEKFTE